MLCYKEKHITATQNEFQLERPGSGLKDGHENPATTSQFCYNKIFPWMYFMFNRPYLVPARPCSSLPIFLRVQFGFSKSRRVVVCICLPGGSIRQTPLLCQRLVLKCEPSNLIFFFLCLFHIFLPIYALYESIMFICSL